MDLDPDIFGHWEYAMAFRIKRTLGVKEVVVFRGYCDDCKVFAPPLISNTSALSVVYLEKGPQEP